MLPPDRKFWKSCLKPTLHLVAKGITKIYPVGLQNYGEWNEFTILYISFFISKCDLLKYDIIIKIQFI